MPANTLSRLLSPYRPRLSALLRRFVRSPRIHPEAVAMDDPDLYVRRRHTAGKLPMTKDNGHVNGVDGRLVSCLCTAQQIESDVFRDWCDRLRDHFSLHRKLWEWCYICQALFERGLLAPGMRGLGFAVGKEPLPSLFASLGCDIVATDLDVADPRGAGWTATNQLAAAATELNARQLCEAEAFRRRVTFRRVDMNRIPDDLQGFDFTWSSCSFEHCGSIELGQEFLCRQMNCLRPGGVAVHTTEFNLSSNRRTIAGGETVIFRRRDMECLVRRLRAAGHFVEPLDLTLDKHPRDCRGDQSSPPAGHLQLQLGPYLATSIGLIVRKGGEPLTRERR